ncbi:MAG: endonuclease MutS2 [Deinococcota bacterium]
MNVTATTLEKLDFSKVLNALAERASSSLGRERALKLRPTTDRDWIHLQWQRTEEALTGTPLSLGGVNDIRPLLTRVEDGDLLDGKELLEIAYTMDASGTIKRAILASERPLLSAMAEQLGSFDGALRIVREQLDPQGKVRDNATPKLRDIRRRLHPLRGRIREQLQKLLERHSDAVQDAIITLRRDRYVIPIRANAQHRVPGIVLDSSDSGATAFVEPQSVVPLNNELALLEFEERDEVRRILISLGQRLAYEPGLSSSLETLAELDVIAASARLAKAWQLTLPAFNDTSSVNLSDARHPLIEGCVPNSLGLSQDARLLILSGPNAGGKTVLLKTLGLALLMGYSGLFVAAKEPSLPQVDALLSDIGDEQSIEASLSTYAGHLTNLRAVLEVASRNVVVLIDELGSGTDPTEGAALSQAILEALLDKGALGLITTHLAPLKAFAADTEGVQNAAMRFDVAQLRPKYELLMGQPGRSYALAIAARLGLAEGILTRAETLLSSEASDLEGLLESLEADKEQLEQNIANANDARDQAIREAELLRTQINTLRTKEQDVMAAAAERADAMLQDTLRQAKELKKVATTDKDQRGKALEDIQSLRKDAQKTAQKSSRKGSRKLSRNTSGGGRQASKPKIQVGTTVYVEAYDASGPVVELRGEDVAVQLGLLKVTVPVAEVNPKQAKQAQPDYGFAAPSLGQFERELNIRGERVEQGLEKVRDFLLEARSLKVTPVRILHGKGTGTLRDAVRNYLKSDSAVTRFEDAIPYEGGHGVTVAHLRL